MSKRLIKFFSLLLCFCFLFEQSGFAQVAGQLDISGHLAQLRNSLTPDKFRPLHLRFISYDNLNNNFKLLLDKGDLKHLKTPELENSTKTLLNYFFIGITLPNDRFWVNLRPDSAEQIIDDALAKTDVGKILLEADLQLKKDTAQFTSPETPEGKDYWEKLYKKAGELFGSENITIPTLTRPWIVPDEIIIRETDSNAYIYKATLKVMLEEDYLVGRGHLNVPYNFNDPRLRTLNEYSSQLIRERIIPKLTKEVNIAKRYAPLRQVYYSLILAQWFKQRFYGKGGLYSWLIDKKNLTGLTSTEPWSKATYFKEYQKSFQQGEYNIKEPIYTPFGQTIRSYMSGGMNLAVTMPAPAKSGEISQSAASPVTIIGANPTKKAPQGKTIGIRVRGGSVDDLEGSIEIERGQQLDLPEKAEPAIKPQEIKKETSSSILAQETGVVSSPLDNQNTPKIIQKVLQWAKIIAGARAKDLATSPSASLPEQTPQPDAQTVRSSQEAFSFTDVSQDFFGVDLEHFIHAQYRLAQGELSEEVLKQLLKRLNLDSRLSGDSAYQAIYERLIDGGYTKPIIELINADTYADPRLGIEIIGQNPNPRAQGVYEAVANSLDALGFSIGQFGKGVKQIIDWLEPTGEDRIDVFTRAKSQDGTLGQPYQLSILKDKQGQYYIQLKKITGQAFQQITDEPVEHGTIVRVTTKTRLPRTDEELDPSHRNSQASMTDGIHRRFAYVPSVNITTQIRESQPQQVNGFGKKVVIVPAKALAYVPAERYDRNIRVSFTDNTITVVDNGSGMNAETLARMFVPKQGTKHPEPLHGQAARAELAKVKVVEDRSLPHRVSFSRNGEIVVAIDTSPDIQDSATVPGGLMLEFGSLLDVPESRDSIIIPLDLKPGEISNFQLAVEHAINQIIRHPNLSHLDKVRYVNTIIAGLDGLVQGNPNYGHVIRTIRGKTQAALSSIIAQLREKGLVILPHNRQFEKLAIPEGKHPLFVHEHLFNWQGAVSLKELGGEIVPGITLNGEQRLPLVVVAFTPESMQGVEQFNPQWHTWSETKRLPIIRTDRFVAIPLQLGKRLYELATKRASSPLTKDEEEEFTSLAQLVNTITASKVTTSYEVTEVEQQMAIIPVTELQRSTGKIDSEAINSFLTTPPVVAQGLQPETKGIPADANQKHILLENGDLLEIGSGRKIRNGVDKIEPLINGYYKLQTAFSSTAGALQYPLAANWYEVVKLEGGRQTTVFSVPSDISNIIISPDKRYAYVRHRDGTVDSIFDLEEGKLHYLHFNFLPLTVSEDFGPRPEYSDLQFSHDGKYLTYLAKSSSGKVSFVVVNLQTKKITKKASIGLDNIEYSLNPFANVAFVYIKDRDIILPFDLETESENLYPVTKLHADSTGTYTVAIGMSGDISIYLHKAKKWLTASDFGVEEISSVSTYWHKGEAFFGAETREKGNRPMFIFDENGSISTHDIRSVDYAESFNSTGEFSILSNASPDTILLETTMLDPLQRTETQGAYKHPHFDLFIDNSDPAHPVAINPISGRKFPYEGKILASLYLPQSGQPGEPGFAAELDYIVVQNKNNEIVAIKYAQVNDVYQAGPTRTIPWLTQAAITTQAPYFAVGTDTPGFLDRNNYILYNLSLPGSANDLDWTLARVLPIPLTYSQVSYDGAYFVFVNPESGDVIYLDPEHPDQPIHVAQAQSTQPTAPVAPFLSTIPADVPSQHIITQDSDGKSSLMNIKWGERYNIPYRVTRLERMNSRTFIAYTERGLAAILEIHEDDNGLTSRFSLTDREIGMYTVVAHNDRHIILERRVKGEESEQFILGVGGNWGLGKAARAIHFSSSGRFSVHVEKTGELVYYDHNDNTSMSAKLISRAGEYQEYLVSDRADAVIIKDSPGWYSIYSLPQRQFVIIEDEHIEIDSSGTIAIGKDHAGLGYVNLKTGEQGGVKTTFIRVSSDNEGVYLSYKDGAGVIVWSFDKKSGLYLGSQGGYAGLPRFWEQYDTEKKTIWDRETAQNLGPKIEYQENPPANPSQETRLVGDTVIWWNKKEDGRTRVFKFELDKPPQDYYHTTFVYELDSLQGGKVWYRKGEGGVNQIRSVRFAGKSFGPGFVNQSKAFILVTVDKAIYYLIDSNGNIIAIADQIPNGFVPTDVNGDYFVFTNPQTGEIRYLDPRKVEPTSSMEVARPSSKEVQQALNLWNERILAKRDQWIAQAKAIYQSFIALIPEEYRGEIERLIKPAIEQIYQQQEQEIRRRFQHALESGQPLDLSTPLPFDELGRRVNHVRQELEEFLAYAEEVINQEEALVRLKLYRNLLPTLFNLVLNRDFDIAKLSAYALHAVALGWDISRQDQLDDAPLVAALYQALSQFRTGPPLSISEAMKILSFASHISSKGQEQHRILITQLKKLLPDVSEPSSPGFEATMTKRLALLAKLRESFQRVELSVLLAYLDNPEVYHNLGEAKAFAVFLSNEVEPVKERARVILRGEDIPLPGQGVNISQIMNLELKRPKRGRDEVVMSIDYLLANLDNLPAPAEEGEAEILRNTTVQRESGAYTAEIAQNSRDATRGTKGILEVDFYLQPGESGKTEYVEEARDNGTGALQEVALLIPKSTKAAAEQMDVTGFFGTGKYTIFEGVDRVEIITKNQDRAYAFIFTVFKGNGQATAIKLTGIRRLTDPHLKPGVTVRRIKMADNTIPELDQMLAQRSWKTFAGLAQYQTDQESFTIYFLDHESKRQKLEVEKAVLSETEFRAVKVGEQQVTDFGTMRIISTKDMPLQVVDKAGLRIKEIPQEYLALVPAPLRKHIKELGINIQIPTKPLIRGRSAFGHETEYLPVIQRYVAIELYKAIAYKTLTQTTPQFVFENFPMDWETNDHYWDSLNLQDQAIVNLAERINKGQYETVGEQELQALLIKPGELDPTKKFTKLLLLLEVYTPSGRISLLLRRLAIQQELNAARAAQQAKMLNRLGLEIGAIPDVRTVPNYETRLAQGRSIETAHEQMRHPEQYIVDPSQYRAQEQKLVRLALSVAQPLGLEQVLLVSNEVQFAGAFIRYQGKTTMLLNRSLANTIGQKNSRLAILDGTTDTINHELAHFLEELMRFSQQEQVWKEGFVSHSANFTHDAVGTFAEAMKYVAGLWLAARASTSSPLVPQPPQVAASPLADQTDTLGKCVTADTLLRLADGRQVPIVKVKPGDYVLSLNEETQAIEPRRIKGLLDMGVKPVYKLTTASGRSIKTTANHPYLTAKGWVKVSNLKAGDEIGVPVANLHTQRVESRKVTGFRRPEETRTDIRTDEDGINVLFQGKGRSKNKAIVGREMIFNNEFISLKESFPVNVEKGDALDMKVKIEGVYNLLKIFQPQLFPLEMFIYCPHNLTYRYGGDGNDIRFFSKDFVYRFCSYLLPISFNQGASIKEINHYLRFLVPNFRDSLTESAFDFRKQTAHLFQRDSLLRQPGLGDIFISRSNRQAHPLKVGNGDFLLGNAHFNPFYPKDNTILNFLSSLFLEAFAADIAPDILWDRIISIEPVSLAHVYDIEVEGTHNFIGNGIFAHNTYIKGAASPLDKSPQGAASPVNLTRERIMAFIKSHNGSALGKLLHIKVSGEQDPGDIVTVYFDNERSSGRRYVLLYMEEDAQPWKIAKTLLVTLKSSLEESELYRTLYNKFAAFVGRHQIEHQIQRHNPYPVANFRETIKWFQTQRKALPLAPGFDGSIRFLLLGVAQIFPQVFLVEFVPSEGNAGQMYWYVADHHGLYHSFPVDSVLTLDKPKAEIRIGFRGKVLKIDLPQGSLLGISFDRAKSLIEKFGFYGKMEKNEDEQPIAFFEHEDYLMYLELIGLQEGKSMVFAFYRKLDDPEFITIPLVNFNITETDLTIFTSDGQKIVVNKSAASPLADQTDTLGKCVTADTLLRLADGRQVPIVEVKAGDYALSLNEETQAIEPRRIKGLLDMGVKPVYRITTQSGKTLKTTLNHPYLTKSGWMKLKDIKKGEEILVAENLFRPDSDFVSFHDKKFSFELGWRKFLEEIKGILNNFFLTHIFNINNCYAQGGFYIEAQDIAKIPVKSKQDTFVLQGITKDIAIRGNSEVCLIGRDDLQSVLPERNDNISVNALVGKDNHRQSLSLRDCLGRVFHKLRGIFNGSNNIFFGNAGILPGDIIQGVSRSNEIEDVVYSNARSSNTGLAKSNIRVNHNSVFIHNPNSFILKDNIVTESSQDDLKIAFEPIVSIEYLGKKHVYDIEVEGTHNFIANGIFAHNTYIKGAASPIAKSGKSAASPLEERASPTMSDWARGRRKTLWGIAGTLATLGLPGVPGADIGIVETPQLPKVTSEQINIQNIINRARAGDKEAFHILGQLALQDNRGALNALVELADKGSAEALGELIQLVKGDGQNVAVQREIKQRLNGFNPSPFVGEAKKGVLPVIKLLYELVMDFENTAAAYALLEVANAAPERVAREEATRWLWMLAKNKGRESIAALLMRDVNPQPILEEIASMLTEMQSPTALGHANLNRVLNLIRLLLSLAEYDNISAEVSLPGIVVDNLVNRQGVDDAALLATLAVLVKHGNPSAVNLIETLVKNGVKEALFSLISLGEIETERIKELDISRLEVLAEAGNKDAKYILSQLAQWDNEGAAEAVRKLNLDKPSPTDKAQPPVGSSPIADKKGGIDASTPLSIDSREVGKGGIDFRGLPIVTQPMGSSPLGTAWAGQVKPLAGRVPVAHLDAEWREIENMLNAGIIPSTERIKEYLQSCCQEKNFPQEIDKVLSCLADILRLEEERVSSTEPALKEILVLLESDKPMEEFQPGLSKISVEPKEPKLLEQ